MMSIKYPFRVMDGSTPSVRLRVKVGFQKEKLYCKLCSRAGITPQVPRLSPRQWLWSYGKIGFQGARHALQDGGALMKVPTELYKIIEMWKMVQENCMSHRTISQWRFLSTPLGAASPSRPACSSSLPHVHCSLALPTEDAEEMNAGAVDSLFKAV